MNLNASSSRAGRQGEKPERTLPLEEYKIVTPLLKNPRACVGPGVGQGSPGPKLSTLLSEEPLLSPSFLSHFSLSFPTLFFIPLSLLHPLSLPFFPCSSLSSFLLRAAGSCRAVPSPQLTLLGSWPLGGVQASLWPSILQAAGDLTELEFLKFSLQER